MPYDLSKLPTRTLLRLLRPISRPGLALARLDERIARSSVGPGDRTQLSELVQRVRDGRVRTNIGKVPSLDDAVAAFNSTERRAGKTVIRILP